MMKLNNLYWCLLLLPFLTGGRVLAQQDAQFSQYMFNQLYYNPAYSGVKDNPTAVFVHRSQWVGFNSTNPSDGSGAPQTQALNFSMPFRRINSGAGLSVLNESIGPLNNLQLKGSYAYHVKIDEFSKVSLGLGFGIYNQRVRTELWRESNPGLTDNTLDAVRQGLDNKTNVDMAFGAWYTRKDLYIGASLNHLTRDKLSFKSSDSIKLENHMFLTAGYRINLTRELDLLPSTLIKTEFKSVTTEITGLFDYASSFLWAGFSVRGNNGGQVLSDVVFLAGVGLLKDRSLRIGYSYDRSILSVGRTISPSSHEIMLNYLLPAPANLVRPPIKTPRFNF